MRAQFPADTSCGQFPMDISRGHYVDNALDVEPFWLFLFTPKTVRAASVSGNAASAAIHGCLPKLIPQPRKILNAIGGRCFSVIFTHLSSAPGQFFVLSRFTRSQQKASLLTSKKKRKCTFRPAPRCSFEAHSVTTYHLNARRFRLLGHIPHNLVDRPIQPATVAQRPSLRPSQRRSLTKKHPASIKNKEKKRRILRSSS